jgi:hypothetical protein
MPDPTTPKMRLPPTHQVLVCEIRDGQRWPITIIDHGPQGAVIHSGAMQAARAMAVLPSVVAAVEEELARQDADREADREKLRAVIQEAAARAIETPFPPDPEAR